MTQDRLLSVCWNRGGRIGMAFFILGCTVISTALAATEAPQSFKTPDAAITALVEAVRADNTSRLEALFGPPGQDLINSGDPVADQHSRQAFLKAYDEVHAIVVAQETRAELRVGKDDWVLPIPLVKTGEEWRFDTRQGAQEILLRRIGRNELATIQVCRAIVEAQLDYAVLDTNNDGLLEYAPKFVSTPGKHDGLYWETKEGEPLSPLGPLLAAATHEGYSDSHARPLSPYHGYYYKFLSNQGPAAPGGAYDFVVQGHMIGGFAVIAYPAHYGVSGIMTFIVNQNGVVYQQDLGEGTKQIASQMTTFNPDSTWSPVTVRSAMAE